MRLRLESPQVLVPGDRFVLRQCSPAATIGGGIVIDAHPLPNLRKAKCLEWLEVVKSAPLAQQLLLRVARRAAAGIPLSGLMAETGLTSDALLRYMGPLIHQNRLVRMTGDLLITAEVLRAAIENITNRLKTDAASLGLRRAELKSQTGLSKVLFDFSIEKLAREQRLRLKDEFVCTFESNAQVGGKDRIALAAIADAYQAAGLAAPQAAEVAATLKLSDAEMRRLMTLLLRDRILIRMGAEAFYIHQSALVQLRAQMSELRGQTLDVGGFKQLTGLSRKYAIPLLEFLGRERVTRKVGQQRLVL